MKLFNKRAYFASEILALVRALERSVNDFFQHVRQLAETTMGPLTSTHATSWERDGDGMLRPGGSGTSAIKMARVPSENELQDGLDDFYTREEEKERRALSPLQHLPPQSPSPRPRGGSGRSSRYSAAEYVDQVVREGHTGGTVADDTDVGMAAFSSNTSSDPPGSIPWLRIRAQEGDVDGMYWLGVRLVRQRWEVAPRGQPHEGHTWLQRASARGHLDATVDLAYMYDQEIRRPEEATWRYLVGVSGGHPIAMHNLGVMLLLGTAVGLRERTSRSSAANPGGSEGLGRALIEAAAEYGGWPKDPIPTTTPRPGPGFAHSPDGRTTLGACPPRPPLQPVPLPVAYALAVQLSHGDGHRPFRANHPATQSAYWYRVAATHGHGPASMWCAQAAFDAGDEDGGWEWLGKAAAAGHGEAWTVLALLLPQYPERYALDVAQAEEVLEALRERCVSGGDVLQGLREGVLAAVAERSEPMATLTA